MPLPCRALRFQGVANSWPIYRYPECIRSGTGLFGVAGLFLRRFASHLQFRNLGPGLMSCYC